MRRVALDRLLDLAQFDTKAVRMRLEMMAAEMRHGEARREYEDWKERYRATLGFDPPDIWPVDEGTIGSAVRELSHQEA
jgi:DNA-binding SARP family transcriptional activator